MTDAADASSDSSPSLLRRIAIWGGSILGGLFVLILVAALLIPQFFTSEELKGYVIPPMEEATGRQVEIDNIGLRVLWTPAVSVSGFRLANREGYGPEPGVEAQELNVEVALWPLLTGAIEPSAVELVDPVIRYEIAEDGSTNFEDLMGGDTTEAAAEEDEAVLSIPVSNFRTTGAQVRYRDRSTGQALELDFDAQLSALPDGNALTSAGTIDVQALRAVLPDVREDTLSVTDATITYDVRAALADGQIDLSDLTIETAPITVSTTGAVTRLNTRPAVDLTVETREADLAQLAAFAPAAAGEGLNPQGSLQLKTTIQGPLPDSTGAMDSLAVDGTGQLSGIGVDYQGRALLRDFSADLALSLQEAAVRSMQGQLLGADLSGNVAVGDPMGTPQVDLDLETGAMNLADLAAFAPPEQVEGYNPQGTLQLAIKATGPIPEDTEGMDQLTVDGTGQLAGVGVDYDGTAMLRELGADLSFSSTTAAVQGLKGQLLGKPLEGTVTIRDPLGSPAVDGRLAGAADIAELASLAGEDAEMEGLRGTADYDVQFVGPVDTPDAIRPNGRIRLTEFRYPYEGFRHPVEIPDATVRLTGTGLSMDRFTIQTGEQSMALQTTVRNLFPISKGLAETNPAMAVDFAFTSDRLDLVELYPEATGDTSEVYYSQLFAATLSGSKVNGRSPEAVAKKLYGGTELPAYAVDGDVEIATFLNDPQRVDNLAFDVQMRDRRLEMRNLSGTTYEGQLAGSITFDQSGSATSAARSTRESVLLASTTGGAAPMPPASDLDYDIRLKGARAGAFLEDWTTLGRVVNGTLDLEMNGDTPLTEGFLPVANALTAKGTSIVANGGLSLNLGAVKMLTDKLGLGSALTSFKRFGGPFTIENGTLEMGTWEMGGASTNARLSGALGLGGSVDVEMRMDLPLTALQKSNIPGLVGGKVTSLVQKLAGGDVGSNTIPVRVQVGGTMSDPTVEVVDKEAVRSAIQKMVKEEGLNRVRNLFDGG
ncbi:AsmA-like C-terminal region-containing protein [Salinibacter sp. 10B]|uniref:DUF748 domain-containing protein n=1 Tax=Salinibacter sp. 10B TaxID=1923971 RepID=UPI000CF57022|nr:AsmA-like C-terminal region-containing protein [Salinibacter sp. 10B]